MDETSDTIPEAATALLVALGRSEHDTIILRRLARFDFVNRQHWSAWEKIAASMDEDTLLALLKGAVKADAQPGWGGGSVAAGIWIARVFAERFPARWLEASEWLRAHSSHNHYLSSCAPPHPHLGPETWTRYVDAEVGRLAAAAAREQELREKAAERRGLRAARSDLARERRVRSALARTSRLAAMAAMPDAERLASVARDRSVTLAYYPSAWGALPAEAFAKVPTDVVALIAYRCRLRSSRTWRAIGQRTRAELRSRGVA